MTGNVNEMPCFFAITLKGNSSSVRWVTVILAAAILAEGCGAPKSSEPQPMQETAESFDDGTESEQATTTGRPKSDQPLRQIAPAQFRREERQIVLEDIGIILREVNFDEPIDGQTSVFFSDTEITNQTYATFLADTNQRRDDTELVELEEKRRRGTRTADGGVILSFSTASPSVDIDQQTALWREGEFPAGLEDHPVTLVTIEQATDFCRWLSARYSLGGVFRLPSESEWLFAAYGTDRKYPWGDDERSWSGEATEPVRSRPELRTPDGLFSMWGNVSELILSPSNGYGGETADKYSPVITQWLGHHYQAEEIRGKPPHPRQDYWGYTHSIESRSGTWGFRVVFLPSE